MKKKEISRKNDNNKTNKLLNEDEKSNVNNIHKDIDFGNIRNLEFDSFDILNFNENIFYDIENSGSLNFDDI